MRFSKGAGDNEIVFPLTAGQLSVMTPCNMVNPCVGKKHGVKRPILPEDGEAYKEIQDEVEVTRFYVGNNMLPIETLEKYHPRGDYDGSVIPTPLREAGLVDAQSSALAVRMDNPYDLPRYIISYLLDRGVKLKRQRTKHTDFINPVVYSLSFIGRRMHNMIVKCFEVKYYYGAPRPEEIAGVDGGIFTAYPEGCPAHPSGALAGHGTLAGVTYACITRLFDLTQEQTDLVFDSCYFFANARSLAGVHHYQDNLSGLEFGGMPVGKNGTRLYTETG